MINMKLLAAVLLLCALTHSTTAIVVLEEGDVGNESGNIDIALSGQDYSKALGLSYLFYEAQRSGKLPSSNRVPWRGDSFLNDCVTGGYFDAGDHLKLMFPLSTSLTFLGLAVTEFKDGIVAAGQLNNALDALRWGADFLVAAHKTPDSFVGQIGGVNADHSYWGRPEQQTGERPCLVWDSSKPASDLASAASSALSAAAIAFRPTDPAYADKLIKHAEQLYSMATKNEGKYSSSYTDNTFVYSSYTFRDDLALAATMLWKATGNKLYLSDAKAQRAKGDFLRESYVSWDAVGPVSAILLECGGEATNESSQQVQKFLTDWQECNSNGFKKSPKGLCIAPLGGWGNLRYSTSAAMAMLMQAKCEKDPAKKAKAISWAKSQVDYALGSSGRSFVVGFGNNPPVKPHHRGASCPSLPAPCDWNSYNSGSPNPQVLYGALVGGPPGPGDDYADDRNNYQTNEVAVDFNAGYTVALAGLLALQGGGTPISAPTPTPKKPGPAPKPTPPPARPAPTPVPTTKCDDIAPSSQYTCQQQKQWGKCGESWMQGKFCRQSCGRC